MQRPPTRLASPDADGASPPIGDGAAPRPSMREVFDAHAAFLHRMVLGLGVRPADAEDICQEVLLIVHRKLHDFRGGSLRAWLYGISTRVVSDYSRRAHVRREIPTESLPDRPLDASQADELDHRRAEARLLRVLDELDADKRAAFILYEVEELTLKEVAQALGCPLQTAYSRLQAARQHVRDAFAAPQRTPSVKHTPSKPPPPIVALGRTTS